MTELGVKAVVISYNRPVALKKTIQAICAEGIPPSDILVIDNNSEPQTRNLLTSEFSSVQSVFLSQNIASAGGFAKGMQLAFDSGAEWVWLFNDDSRPVPGALNSVFPYLQHVAASKTGMIKIGQSTKPGMAVALYWNGARLPKLVPVSNSLRPTDLVTFDGCFVSRKLYEAIGTCDPQYFMGTYEFDYCLRAKDAGFEIFTLPNGLLEDEKLGSEKGTPPWRQYYNTRNHLWLGIHRRSFQIIKAWLIRESKYTVALLLKGDQKGQRLLYKYRAIRDALLNRRGKRYHPDMNR
jgi:rhamnopyranosyl-N-acetylglucosaminyl-diphospho-decaprenol beta-1,3/1,4-galactofuranosyltransferase